MSGRGTITSRRMVSPNSKIEWIISRSSSSMTSPRSASSTRARISSSETKGPLARPLPGATTLPMAMNSRVSGPRTRRATRSVCCTARVFGATSANTNVSMVMPMTATARPTPPPISRSATEVASAVAENCVTSSSNSTRLRKRGGSSTSCRSGPAPRRPSSFRCLARMRLMRVRLVSDAAGKAAKPVSTVSSSSSAARVWPAWAACSAAYAGQSTTSPSSQGSSSLSSRSSSSSRPARPPANPGGPTGPPGGPDAGGSSSIGKASTSVGRCSPRKRAFRPAITVGSTSRMETSDSCTPSAFITRRARATRPVSSTVRWFCSLARKTLTGGRPSGRPPRHARGRPSGPGLVVAAVGLHDGLHDAVAHHATAGQVDEGEPVDAGEDLAHHVHPGVLTGGQVDLGDVAGDHGLGVQPEPCQEHLHLLRGGVLRLVEDDERVVQGPAPHVRQGRDLDRAAFGEAADLLGVDHLGQGAGEEAELLSRLDRRAGEDQAVHLLGQQGLHGDGHGQVGLAGAGGADAEDDRVGADRVDVLLLPDRLGLDGAAAHAEHAVAEHVRGAHVLVAPDHVDRAAHGLGGQRVALFEQVDHLLEQACDTLCVALLTGDRDLVAAYEHLDLRLLLHACLGSLRSGRQTAPSE